MPSFNRNEKVFCQNCGTQTTRQILGNHKTRFFAATITYPPGANVSTNSRAETKFYIIKNHSATTARVCFFYATVAVEAVTAFTHCKNLSGRNIEHR